MKILIVEDEQKTGDYLKQGLSEAGFVTDLAHAFRIRLAHAGLAQLAAFQRTASDGKPLHGCNLHAMLSAQSLACR